MINMVELTHVHEILKTLLYKQKIPKCALTETFPSFETTDKRSRAFGFSWRLPDSYSNGTSTGEGFKSANVKSGTTKTRRSGREAMRKKGSILKVCQSKGDFLSSLFLISQKDVKNKPVVNLRDLNRFIPYKYFKVEGLHCLKYVEKRWLHLQNSPEGLKDAYLKNEPEPEGWILQRFSTQRFTKIKTLSLGRGLVRVPVPVLWFGTSSQNIHKLYKGSNLSFETS